MENEAWTDRRALTNGKQEGAACEDGRRAVYVLIEDGDDWLEGGASASASVSVRGRGGLIWT